MAITIQSLVDYAAKEVEDIDGDRWDYTDWVEYTNKAIADVCRLKPDAYTVRGNVKLVAGSVQSLPSDGHQLVRPMRNMGANGLLPGAGIRLVSLDSSTDFDVDWHTEPDATSVDDIMYDPNHPLEFWVFPPAPNYYVELIYAALPTDVVLSDNLPIIDIYKNPVIHFMLGHALSSNRADADFARGQKYFSLAYSSLGIQHQSEDSATEAKK